MPKSNHEHHIKCPTCSTRVSVVTDSRGNAAGISIRRRRECENGHRFSTYEVVTSSPAEVQIRTGKVLAEIDQLEMSVRFLKEYLSEFREIEAQ